MPQPMKKWISNPMKCKSSHDTTCHLDETTNLHEKLLGNATSDQQSSSSSASSSTYATSNLSRHKRSSLMTCFYDHLKSKKVAIYESLQAYLNLLKVEAEQIESSQSNQYNDEEEDTPEYLKAKSRLHSRKELTTGVYNDAKQFIKGIKGGNKRKYLTINQINEIKEYKEDISQIQQWMKKPFEYHSVGNEDEFETPYKGRSLSRNQRQCGIVKALMVKYNPHQQLLRDAMTEELNTFSIE